MKPRDESLPVDEDALPPQGMRTVLSFLLFIHLFAAFAAILGYSRPVSALRNHLSDIPGIRSYLSLLHMNVAYNFHLTSALDEDTPLLLEIEAKPGVLADSGATTPSEGVIIFPDPSIAPGIRATRYRSLMWNCYDRVRNENQESFLPQSIAREVLLEKGVSPDDASKRRVRLRQRNLRAMQDLASSQLSQRDRFAPSLLQTPYEAEVWFTGDDLAITKLTAEMENAAVRRPASGETASPNNASPNNASPNSGPAKSLPKKSPSSE